jgi:DNA-binding MarR family transcriptional regulator
VVTSPLFDYPACLITRLGVHIQEQLTDLLAPLGLQPRHFGLLTLLKGQDGLSQHQLADPLAVHRNVMVGLVDELETRGLVERRRHPTDRRAHAVHLLPAGRALHAESEALITEFEAKLFGCLSPQEATTFVALQRRVSEHAGLHLEVHPGLRPSRPATQSAVSSV